MNEIYRRYFEKETDYNAIIGSYVLEEDIIPIAEFTRIFNCAISFREAKSPVLKLMRS